MRRLRDSVPTPELTSVFGSHATHTFGRKAIINLLDTALNYLKTFFRSSLPPMYVRGNYMSTQYLLRFASSWIEYCPRVTVVNPRLLLFKSSFEPVYLLIAVDISDDHHITTVCVQLETRGPAESLTRLNGVAMKFLFSHIDM